jgi:hypothetical protein
MIFQTAMFVSMMVMLAGGALYYFNEEYPERITMTRVGLAITVLGLLLLVGSIIFLRQWPR